MAQRQYFRIDDFSGGWNPDRSSNLIADNEATDILNLRLDNSGALVSRSGYSPLITPGLDGIVHGIGRWDDPESEDLAQVIIALNDKLFRVNFSNDTFDLLYSGLDSSAEVYFTNAQSYLIITNGVNIPLIYDGQTVKTLGIENPPILSGVQLSGPNGAGGLTGEYHYAYTFLDSEDQTESIISDSRTITASGHDVLISIPVSTNPRVDKKIIYRRDPASAVFLRIAEIDNAVTTYLDTGDTTQLIVPTNTGQQAPILKFTAYYAGYMFGAIEDTIYWSNPLEPQSWSPLDSTPVPFEGNDRITALVAHQDTLVIFGMDNTIILAGQGGNWSIQRMDVGLGCTNHLACGEVEGSLAFLSRQGLRLFPNFEPLAIKLDRTVMGLDYEDLVRASLVYIPEERTVGVSIGNITYTVHLPNRGLSKYSIASRYWLEGGDDSFDLPILVINNQIYRYGGDTDDGASIPIYWESKTYQLTPEKVKHYRRVGSYTTVGSVVTLTFSIPSSGNTYTSVLQSSATQGENWDELVWDNFIWAFEGVSYASLPLPGQRLFGHTLQIKLRADTAQLTEIQPPITIEYRESTRFL